MSKNELVEIDRQVFKNRESVYLFLTKFPSNSKCKAKKLFLYTIFLYNLGQPLVPCTTAVMVPLLPPADIHRLLSIEETSTRCLVIAPVIESKVDKVMYDFVFFKGQMKIKYIFLDSRIYFKCKLRKKKNYYETESEIYIFVRSFCCNVTRLFLAYLQIF